VIPTSISGIKPLICEDLLDEESLSCEDHTKHMVQTSKCEDGSFSQKEIMHMTRIMCEEAHKLKLKRILHNVRTWRYGLE
jgi:hypothetical protein